MLRFLTAGESHGPCLLAIIEGLPAGLRLDEEAINRELRRRQSGYGRGSRQRIERDVIRFWAGVHQGVTLGSPVALMVANRDWENWREREVAPWRRPRPGHADLAGGHKYGLPDLRLVAERASARNTAVQVAVGAVAKALLGCVGIAVGSYVEAIGGVNAQLNDMPLTQRLAQARESDVACPDPATAECMRARIDRANDDGDSLGGIICVVANRLPVGLGTHVHWDRRLDGRLAQAVMSVQAIKGVEIGPAFENAGLPGTLVHDGLYPGERGPVRHTNRAGGLEGGMTNGEPLLIRAAMKPIPTTVASQPTVDLDTGKATTTQYQRSDVCAVPAAAVVAESMVAWVLAEALIERYGGDQLDDIVRRVRDGH